MKRFHIMLLLVICTIILSACDTDEITSEDFTVSEVRYGATDSYPSSADSNEMQYSLSTGKLQNYVSLKVNPDKQMYIKIYDSVHNVWLEDYPRLVKPGIENDFNFRWNFDTIAQSPIVHVCAYNERDFNRFTEGVICESVSPGYPEIKFELVPEKATQTISKNSDDMVIRNNMTLTLYNRGNVGVRVHLDVSNADLDNKISDNPNPWYTIFTSNQDGYTIQPGGSKDYILATDITYIPRVNRETPSGTYYNDLILCTAITDSVLNCEKAGYTETFVIETIVTD